MLLMKTLGKLIFPILVLIHVGARMYFNESVAGAAAIEVSFPDDGRNYYSYISSDSFDWKAMLEDKEAQFEPSNIHLVGNAHLPFQEISFSTRFYEGRTAFTQANQP